MLANVWAFIIYWLVFFVACLAVVETMQDMFYDEVTPRSGLKVALGSLLLAALATWLKPSFDTMFTQDLPWTLLQAMVWVAVFIFVYQFHPPHALGLGLITMALVAGLATLGVDSLTKPRRTLAPVRARQNNEPIRKSFTPPPTATPEPAAAK